MKQKKLLLNLTLRKELKLNIILFFAIMMFSLNASAHTWEIRVKQNANGTLTWYGQSYHSVGECGIANSGININGVNYNWTAGFSGSIVPLTAYIFTASPAYTACCNVSGRVSYGTVTTPFIPGNLVVTAYSNKVCYALYPDMPPGGGTFNPPPPPCTSCPLISWNNTAGTPNNNGTPCTISDDYIPVIITVNHQNCAKSTGNGQFTLVNSSTNTTIGSFVFNATSPTIITYNAPVGTGNSTLLNVSTTFPCNVQQAISSIPNGTFSGIPETTPPTISCPSNITTTTATGVCSKSVIIPTVVFSDNCPGPILSWSTTGATTLSGTGQPGTRTFNKGITTVSLLVTDARSYTATCSFTVTVNDNQAPSLTGTAYGGTTGTNTCKANAATAAPFSQTNALQGYTDNCPGALTATLTNTVVTGTDCNWTVTYTFTVTDANNNALTLRTYSNTGGDQTAPYIIVPGSLPGSNVGNVCYAARPSAPSATSIAGLYADNCTTPTASLTNTVETGNNCGWTVTYTYTITDGCNPITANVLYSGADTQSPTLAGTAYGGTSGTNSCMVNAATAAPFTATDAIQGYTDNCGGAVTAILTGTSVTGTDCAWTVTYTYTVKDACGNELTGRTYSNTGNDQTVPVITTCPSNISVVPNNGGCSFKQSGTGWNATATDNCSTATVKYTLSGATSSAVNALLTLDNVVFNTGVTTVTATAFDVCNNASVPCIFTVTVASTLAATCSNTNPSLYFGYPGDQSATIKAIATGGTAPYTVSITMNRPLKCNVITSTGDELWSGVGGTSVNNVCPATGPGLIPVSTGTVAASGGFYSVNVTLMENATFTATITDAYGCITTCTTNVHAEDVRCFAGNSGNAKVKICHQTSSASNPCVAICVDQSAVATHLSHGDFLGDCTPNCVAPVYNRGVVINTEPVSTGVFNVRAIPNPTESYFTLDVETASNDKIVVVIYDEVGRLLKHIEKSDRQLISFGEEFTQGTYFAIVTQGKNRKVVKLLKL